MLSRLLPVELRLLTTTSPLRRFTTSSSLRNAAPRSFSLEYPSYPGLYLHSLHPSTPYSFSVSFLPTPAPKPLEFSPSTIGFLRSSSVEGSPDDAAPELTPNRFEENKDFKDLMMDVLQGEIESDETIGMMAKTRGEGYLTIADSRAPADPNRVADPNDLLASVYVKDGKVDPSSFEASQTHRLVTRDGMFRLEPSLDRKVRAVLEAVAEEERNLYK